ncbi:MAG: class I SAM-dependent methyltransferase [Bacteroidales bacterium]|nr:class I SAM-dependent methyltransferase [Bacteroidales bacterium]
MFYQAASYLKYFLSAKNAHGIHSPFVFDLYNNVIRNSKSIDSVSSIEALRKELLRNNSLINIKDLGAGHTTKTTFKICNIAKSSLSNIKKTTFLYRLTSNFKPVHIIELGTSLGIATMYISAAAPEAQISTIEGCPEIHALAVQNFQKLNFKNINAINANFNDVLEKMLIKLERIDFVFIDGNHSYEATVRYFNQMLPFLNNNSVLVFDDIYWSKGMTAAWQKIIGHEQVRCSIDLFRMGIVFFRKELSKEHFVIKF